MNGSATTWRGGSDDDDPKESSTLRSLLGDGSADNAKVSTWFESDWQEKATVFRWKNRQSFLTEATDDDDAVSGRPAEFHASNHWKDDAVKASPYEAIVLDGWNALISLLLEASTPSQESHTAHTPLVFKDQCNVTDELESTYHNNLFAAYLDGCSIVLNHSDWASPWIGALCEDLQRSFPHAYSNVYVSPPSSQAVRAHADDRDVIVIQICGKKDWTVYSKIPIPLPYPSEQVGKEGLEVPEEVLKGPQLIKTTLCTGDALYMPRGYCHEARASENEFSAHVTIALATHDWNLAGILTTATEKILRNEIQFRKAINRRIGIRDLKDIPDADKEHLQRQMQEAFQLVQREVTVEALASNLTTKFYHHNHRAFSARMKLIHEIRFPAAINGHAQSVGQQAAKHIMMKSRIRAATPEEKESVMIDQPRGLRVREAVADSIIQILTALKGNPNNDGIAIEDLKSLLKQETDAPNNHLICDLTLLSFAKVCVEQGALAVVHQ